jgi:hypothetical protein
MSKQDEIAKLVKEYFNVPEDEPTRIVVSVHPSPKMSDFDVSYIQLVDGRPSEPVYRNFRKLHDTKPESSKPPTGKHTGCLVYIFDC